MNWKLAILSWLVAFYFGSGFVVRAGFPPKTDLLIGDALFVALTLFFLFVPFFNKIKIGSWIELERGVKEVKKEVASAKDDLREFKAEIRNTMSVVSTNLNTQRMSTQLNIYGTPNVDELRAAQAKLEQKLDAKDQATVKKYESATRAQQENDVPLMLAKVRMDMERLLRRIVGARLTVASVDVDPIRLASTRQLFQRLLASNDHYEHLREPFDYVNKVCNAAIHAQIVSPEQATEALRLGAQIIEVLSKHPDGSDADPEQIPA